MICLRSFALRRYLKDAAGGTNSLLQIIVLGDPGIQQYADETTLSPTAQPLLAEVMAIELKVVGNGTVYQIPSTNVSFNPLSFRFRSLYTHERS